MPISDGFWKELRERAKNLYYLDNSEEEIINDCISLIRNRPRYNSLSDKEVQKIAKDIQVEGRVLAEVDLARDSKAKVNAQKAVEKAIAKPAEVVGTNVMRAGYKAGKPVKFLGRGAKKKTDDTVTFTKKATAGIYAGLGMAGAAEKSLREVGELEQVRDWENRIRELKDKNAKIRFDVRGRKDRRWTYNEREEFEKNIEEINKLKDEIDAHPEYYTPGRRAEQNARAVGRTARSPFFAKIEARDVRAKRLDPKVRSAINKGRGILRKESKKIALNREKQLTQTVNDARERFEVIKKKMEEVLKKGEEKEEGVGSLKDSFMGGAMKGGGAGPQAALIGGAVEAATNMLGKDGAKEAAIIAYTAREMMYERERLDRLEEEMEKELEKDLTKVLVAEADKIAKDIALKEGLDDEKDTISGYLKDEARKLAFFYERQYHNKLKRAIGKIGMISRDIGMGGMTWGDAWLLFWDNIKQILFGPWIWGTLLIILYWLMLTNYVTPMIGGSQWYLYMMPILLGLITFVLNLEATKQPMDWLTHIISGTLIGFAVIVFLIAIWTPQDVATFGFFTSEDGLWYNSWWFFFMIWGFLALFVGVFQFYHAGGFMIVFQMAILILLFSYAALGPYNYIYNQVTDQIKVPVNIAFRAVGTAFSSVWTLATDPQKWYEQQQLMNVQPEVPLVQPQGVEITRLDVLPASVFSGEEFQVVGYLNNDARTIIKDIKVSVSCNSYCIVSNSTTIVPEEFEYGWAPNITEGMSAEEQEEENAKNDMRSAQGNAVSITKIEAGDVEKFMAARMGKITFEIEYTSTTNATLPVTVMSDDEIERRQREGEEVYHNVPGWEPGAIARLSISANPQPIKANAAEATLLIAVSSARDDGTVKLYNGDPIIVHLPDTIGTWVEEPTPGSEEIIPGNCRGQIDNCEIDQANPEKLTCYVDPGNKEKDIVEIDAREVGSIFHFFCDFEPADTNGAPFKTDYIRAELPQYTFVTKKSKTLNVVPLGISQGGIDEIVEVPELDVKSGPAIYVKIDPADHTEVWEFRFTDNPHDENFLLDDDFNCDNNPDCKDDGRIDCVVMAVNEQPFRSIFGSWGFDKRMVWYISEGGIIYNGENGNKMWDGIKDNLIYEGCKARVFSDCDTCVSMDDEVTPCTNSEIASASPTGSSSIGGERYNDAPLEDNKYIHCTDELCYLLSKMNGKYYWKPAYEILCASDGNWHACDVDGTTKTANGNEYMCKDTIWHECSEDVAELILIEETKYICQERQWIEYVPPCDTYDSCEECIGKDCGWCEADSGAGMCNPVNSESETICSGLGTWYTSSCP